jgi:hypothetical protein
MQLTLNQARKPGPLHSFQIDHDRAHNKLGFSLLVQIHRALPAVLQI